MLMHVLFHSILTFFASTVLGRVLQAVSEDVSSEILPRSPELTLPLNVSTFPTNGTLTAKKRLKIACDADRFGRNLKVKSCRDLFGYLTLDEEEYTFSGRDSGIPNDIPLPFRTYSSTLHSHTWERYRFLTYAADDALCFMQPLLEKNAVVGHAAPKEVVGAAAQLLQHCVVERGMGGLAYDIGKTI